MITAHVFTWLLGFSLPEYPHFPSSIFTNLGHSKLRQMKAASPFTTPFDGNERIKNGPFPPVPRPGVRTLLIHIQAPNQTLTPPVSHLWKFVTELFEKKQFDLGPQAKGPFQAMLPVFKKTEEGDRQLAFKFSVVWGMVRRRLMFECYDPLFDLESMKEEIIDAFARIVDQVGARPNFCRPRYVYTSILPHSQTTQFVSIPGHTGLAQLSTTVGRGQKEDELDLCPSVLFELKVGGEGTPIEDLVVVAKAALTFHNAQLEDVHPNLEMLKIREEYQGNKDIKMDEALIGFVENFVKAHWAPEKMKFPFQTTAECPSGGRRGDAFQRTGFEPIHGSPSTRAKTLFRDPRPQCTCGACLDGWFSPRTRTSLFAECSNNVTFLDEMLSDFPPRPPCTQPYCFEMTPLSYFVPMKARRENLCYPYAKGFFECVQAIGEMSLAGHIPTPSSLSDFISRETRRYPNAQGHYVARCGQLDWVIRSILFCASTTSRNHGDMTVLQSWEDEIEALPKCKNDEAYDLVGEKLLGPSTKIFPPHIDDEGFDLPKACSNCGKSPRVMKMCSACKAAGRPDTPKYCDEKCQKAHWPIHKKNCEQKKKTK